MKKVYEIGDQPAKTPNLREGKTFLNNPNKATVKMMKTRQIN